MSIQPPTYTNCQAWGSECFSNQLKTVRITGFSNPICICNACIISTAEDAFKDAASILNNVMAIVELDIDPEDRLQKIKSLLKD